MFETKCVKVKLKPGSLPRVRAWAQKLISQREAARETMRDEGMVMETTFLDRTSEGDFLICLLKAKSFENATAVVKQSRHGIDAYHQTFKKETTEALTQNELVCLLPTPR